MSNSCNCPDLPGWTCDDGDDVCRYKDDDDTTTTSAKDPCAGVTCGEGWVCDPRRNQVNAVSMCSRDGSFAGFATTTTAAGFLATRTTTPMLILAADAKEGISVGLIAGIGGGVVVLFCLMCCLLCSMGGGGEEGQNRYSLSRGMSVAFDTLDDMKRAPVKVKNWGESKIGKKKSEGGGAREVEVVPAQRPVFKKQVTMREKHEVCESDFDAGHFHEHDGCDVEDEAQPSSLHGRLQRHNTKIMEAGAVKPRASVRGASPRAERRDRGRIGGDQGVDSTASTRSPTSTHDRLPPMTASPRDRGRKGASTQDSLPPMTATMTASPRERGRKSGRSPNGTLDNLPPMTAGKSEGGKGRRSPRGTLDNLPPTTAAKSSPRGGPKGSPREGSKEGSPRDETRRGERKRLTGLKPGEAKRAVRIGDA